MLSLNIGPEVGSRPDRMRHARQESGRLRGAVFTLLLEGSIQDAT